MTTVNRRSQRLTSRILGCFMCFGLMTATGILYLFTQKSWGSAVQVLCGFYSIATGLFFCAQVYGFVVSQTSYSDSIESPKFLMLEKEEAEWRC